MTDFADLVKLMQQQIQTQKKQMDKQEDRYREQMELLKERMAIQKDQMDMQRIEFVEQMDAMINRLETGSSAPAAQAASVPSFASFDSTSELWRAYLARFHTFVGANSIPKEKIAQVFLTNQKTYTYKLLCTLVGQQRPLRDINQLSMKGITTFMQNQFDPK